MTPPQIPRAPTPKPAVCDGAGRLIYAFIATFTLLLTTAPLHAADPPNADIDAQYAATLAVMKHPPVTGILVTEIAPASPAGSAGLRAGDIIIRLAGQDVRTLPALRELVADLLAASTLEEKAPTVPLAIRRQLPAKNDQPAPETQTLTLQIPRQPLGIRAIEVEAGVPSNLNPPPSPRGSINLAWDDLRKLQNNGGDLGQKTFFRTNEADGPWLGWQQRSADPAADDALSGRVDITRVASDDNKTSIVATESVSFRLRTGDYKTAPAFLLESADATTKAGYGAVVTTTAVRAGANLRVATEITYSDKIEGPFKRETPCPTDSLLPAAVPLLASAMPQAKDAVLPLHLMSARDFVPRPGYVLATKGKQPLPDQPPATQPAATNPAAPDQAWRIDLMHCGIVVESYWINDQRHLLRTDSFSGTTLISRHVANETEARVIVLPKLRPTTTPYP